VGGLGHSHGGPVGLGTRGPGGDDFWVSLGVGKHSALYSNSSDLFPDLLGLDGDDLGGSRGGVQRPGHTAAPRTCPWSFLSATMVQMLRTCQSSQTSYLQPPRKYLPRCSETIGCSLVNGVGSRVDSQPGLGVLFPVYQR
jgi:hypothetical protein